MRKGVTREKSKNRNVHTHTESSLQALDLVEKKRVCVQAKEVNNGDF